ncbi:kremen protein 1-like [Xenia sp. Carnegie-2017]|uniref:kremen protein 1-like n=1 Tax=Xenia sp. Carnegie-2017 TaxID=2897299 RepID=UPI001F034A0C|nr:kremen protein 1-like [Xenia sp. Carnegie-2017]XP_046842600.1 kremen protein 1-like [Xenia sp. Carnegie-2017]
MKKTTCIFLIFLHLVYGATEYLGCYKDGSPRDLSQRLHHNNMTADSCVSGCREQEYEYAALQFAYLCFCGDHYGTFGKLPDEMCDSVCKSPGDQYCGGDWKNSVYATGFKSKKRKDKETTKTRPNSIIRWTEGNKNIWWVSFGQSMKEIYI